MSGSISFRTRGRRFRAGLILIGSLLWVNDVKAAEPEVLTNLESMRDALADVGSRSLSFDLDGTVCDTNNSLGSVVIQDPTSTVLLELPAIPDNLRAGMVVRISGRDCWANRGTSTIQLGTAPLMGLDGLHGDVTQNATAVLRQGDQPFRLEWFNANGPFSLKLEIEGEGMPRMEVPEAWFKHRESDDGPWSPGLDYNSYVGERWFRLPDFSRLKAEKRGVVAGLRSEVMGPRDSSAVVYTGALNIPRTGEYHIYLTSDDGSRLYCGAPNVSCEIVSSGLTSPSAVVPALEVQTSGRDQFWGIGEGKVIFAGMNHGRIEMELSGTLVSPQVTVVDPQGMEPADFLGKSVKVTGLKSASGMVVLNGKSIEFARPSEHPAGVLTTASEIHQLRPEEAEQGRPVKLLGVVTMVSSQSFVLQDSSGGVYVSDLSYQSGVVPQVKEIWEVEGQTDDGDFSPMVRTTHLSFRQSAELPKGVRPTRSQFADGSLDAQQVEIDGIVASSSPLQLELLTQEGSIFVNDDVAYRLPTQDFSEEKHASLVGSVVKLRGVYTATWDSATRRVKPSNVRLGNAVLSVTNPAPDHPFKTELIKATDLLLFNSETRAFQRVKVAGMILCRKGNEIFANDGKSGFRVISRNAEDLNPGDLIEAVGFPRLDGSSPLLLQSQTRKTGSGPLPKPVVLSDDFISNPHLDSTQVSIRGTLVSDTKMENLRTLELEKGSITFLAHVPLDSNSSALYRPGSLLDLTGVYVRAIENHITVPVEPFEIEIVDAASITILRNGPWWTPKHTLILICTLCGLLLLTSVGATLLRRTVVKRTGEIAVHIREREIIERQRVLDQERSRVAQDLHDELGAGLTEVGILASLANNPSVGENQKVAYLAQLKGVCRTLVTGLDEIVWAVNPNYDAVADLAGYFSLFAQQFLHLADIGCRLNIPESIPSHRLGSHERHGIFLAFKEALNNVVKHSRATMVHLTLEVQRQSLIIRIADNGQGFELDPQQATGEGLRGMRARIDHLGGRFHLDTGKTDGTTITFEIPLETP